MGARKEAERQKQRETRAKGMQREPEMETEGKAASEAMRRGRKQQGKERRKKEKAGSSIERQRMQEGETDRGGHVRQSAQLGTRARVQARGSRSRPLTGGCPIPPQQGPPASPAELGPINTRTLFPPHLTCGTLQPDRQRAEWLGEKGKEEAAASWTPNPWASISDLLSPRATESR